MSERFAASLVESLSEKATVLDRSLAESAYNATRPSTPFNLTSDEARQIGVRIGCEFFIILKAGNQRRSSFGREEYYEAFAPIYVFSTRSGRMIWWKLARFEALQAEPATARLFAESDQLAVEIKAAVSRTSSRELAERSRPDIEEVPTDDPPPKNFKAPIPFRRIKPEYTNEAAMYDVTATVDLLADIGASGMVLRTEIVRFAGYWLDESVEKAVRTMNWRAAERDGKFVPMRVLLRYNFKKSDKE